jgi:hypothetical protein
MARHPLDLRDLPGDAPDGPGRTRDDHGLALARAADVEQPEVRGQASAGFHHRADRDRLGFGGCGVDPAEHGRIYRQIRDRGHEFPGAGHRDGPVVSSQSDGTGRPDGRAARRI